MHDDASDSDEAMSMSDDTPQSAEVLFISPIGIVPKTEEDDSRKTGWLSDEEIAGKKLQLVLQYILKAICNSYRLQGIPCTCSSESKPQP